VDDSGLGRAFFERQQERRRAAQFRLTGTRPSPPSPGPQPAAAVDEKPSALERAPEPEPVAVLPEPAPEPITRQTVPPEPVDTPTPKEHRVEHWLHHVEHSIASEFEDTPPAPAPAVVRVIVTAGDDAGQSFDVPVGDLLIGRAEDAPVHLADPTVSHHHAMLRVGVGTVTIEDLNSTNGTRVNDQPVASNVEIPLVPGDNVAVGKVRFAVHPPDPARP
jgi:hypothetical protein